MKRLLILHSFSLLLFSCGEGKREIIFTAKAPKPIGPYSQAVKADNHLYVSGQIALRANGSMDTSSIENECRQVMENIRAIVEAAGSSMSRISKATIYCTDLKDFSALNSVYGSYFESAPPARETVQVEKLPKGAHVEISVVVD
jgi:2-iminobutanoate/2-iminopropanoate deaminase